MRKIVVICIVIIISCNNIKTPESMNVICFDTEEFIDFERNAKINKEEAWLLQIEYCQQNNLEWGSPLYFVLDGNYIFSEYVIPKMNRAGLNGIWVNANTGEVKKVEKKTEVIQSKGYHWRGKIELK